MDAKREVVAVGERLEITGEHPFDVNCPMGCLSCEDDVAWMVDELGESIVCGECRHLVLADLGAWTSDDPAEYRS